jgi:hypothetical protein
MKHGLCCSEQIIHHPDYLHWGLAGERKIIDALLPEEREKFIKSVKKLPIDTGDYCLSKAYKVSYYDRLINPEAILLRFEKQNKPYSELSGEHFSIILEASTNKLLGLTRMVDDKNNASLLNHQQALSLALAFLALWAPDLIPANIQIPELNELKPHEKMVFEPALSIGNIELSWIALHTESIFINKKEILIEGMKVKMFIPSTELWVWIIVGKNGEIQTFERNIDWDFDKMQRKTEMWLHDKWLITQKLDY